ncbi:MAG: hypothetical protein ACKO8F_04510, partial [Acidimicrobiaceae bacterium]
MFSNLDKPNVDLFTGTSPVRSKISGHFTSELLQFAKTGKVSWPTYETSERSTFRIDEDVKVLTLPDPAIRKLWNLSSSIHFGANQAKALSKIGQACIKICSAMLQ